jgi:hypothetical protein
MNNFKRAVTAVAVLALLVGSSFRTPAQNMGGTVVTQRVKFARGKSSATLRGRAKYGMSYVYNIGARQGQYMTIQLKSDRGLVDFSLTAPDSQTVPNAFLVKDWSGDLAQSGDYAIVVVMNDESASNVAYVLEVSIK